MKPYQLGEVAALLAPLCRADVRIDSILAGTRLADLRTAFPAAAEIVRAMPNLPVGIGEGVIALHAEAALPVASRTAVEAFIAPLGLAEWRSEERRVGKECVSTGRSRGST